MSVCPVPLWLDSTHVLLAACMTSDPTHPYPNGKLPGFPGTRHAHLIHTNCALQPLTYLITYPRGGYNPAIPRLLIPLIHPTSLHSPARPNTLHRPFDRSLLTTTSGLCPVFACDMPLSGAGELILIHRTLSSQPSQISHVSLSVPGNCHCSQPTATADSTPPDRPLQWVLRDKIPAPHDRLAQITN